MNPIPTPRGSLTGSDGWRVTPEYAAEAAPRQKVTYYCGRGHEVTVTFAADAQLPDTWPCATCSDPAGLDPDNPPGRPVVEVFKTHFDYVLERRSPDQADELMAEALERARQARGRS